jgi:hypothetical protein
VKNGGESPRSHGGDAGETGVAAEGVVGVENNILGLVLYKEPVNFLFSRFFLRFLLLQILQIVLLQFFEFCFDQKS